jgi:hypothetical protein
MSRTGGFASPSHDGFALVKTQGFARGEAANADEVAEPDGPTGQNTALPLRHLRDDPSIESIWIGTGDDGTSSVCRE